MAMTFLALLTKEMRLRLRRERTIWVIIAYLLLVGVAGWFSLNNNSGYTNVGSTGLSQVGPNLYSLLAHVQIFLIVFITPAFTTMAINGEKERQTFDLLLCSRISSFSLIAGKLVAGLVNVLLLIATSIPLFSLVFFFGGVSPGQVLSALAVFLVTTLLLATFGLFCSSIFQRPAISMAIAYATSLIWMLLPFIAAYILTTSGDSHFFSIHPIATRLLYLWNPNAALVATYANEAYSSSSIFSIVSSNGYGGPGSNIAQPLNIANWNVSPWVLYIYISLLITNILFALCVFSIKPRMRQRLHARPKKPLHTETIETVVQ